MDKQRIPGSGRPSIPPERLLCAQVLQALYNVRIERMRMERQASKLTTVSVRKAFTTRLTMKLDHGKPYTNSRAV